MQVRKAMAHMMTLQRDFKGKQYLRMPYKEQQSGIRELTGGGFKLLTWFWSKEKSEPFSTSEFSKHYKLGINTVTRAHRELQEKGYLFVEHLDNMDLYVLGKENVARCNELRETK